MLTLVDIVTIFLYPTLVLMLKMLRDKQVIVYATATRLKRQFVGCSFEVKKQLFTSDCTNLYCAQLWVQLTQSSWSSVRVAYNTACRIVLGLERF